MLLIVVFCLLVIVAVCCSQCWNFSNSRKSTQIPQSSVSKKGEVIRVSCVSARCNRVDGSIKVQWASLFPHHTVSGYEMCYEKLFQFDRLKTKSIDHFQNSCILTRTDDGIEPFNKYNIKVRPISDLAETEWTSTTVYVDWYCQYPGCTMSRRKRDRNTISKFCSASHAEKFNANYCLFPECTLKCEEHFCPDHLHEAIAKGICGFVKLDNKSVEFSKLERTFSSSWCSKKGLQPKIWCILKVVSPSMKKRFDKYLKSLPWRYQIVEQYYHGTQLECVMLQFYEPCSSSTCGMCGISKMGFDQKRIKRNMWQRFGNGFYFAPNSSKSYDYPLSGRQNSSVKDSCPYRCILVCDIAVGCKYTLYRNEPKIKGPPSGYHSIYGKSRWMWLWKSPDLNYDELAVFEADAIRPAYILFCENTTQ